MDMQMHHGLSGGGPVINPDIKAVRLVLLSQKFAALSEQSKEGRPFSGGRVKQGCEVAFGDDQKMPRIDGVFIKNSVGQIVFEDWVLKGAEDAVVHGYFLFQIKKQKDLFIVLKAILKVRCSFMTAQKEPKRRHGTKFPGPSFYSSGASSGPPPSMVFRLAILHRLSQPTLVFASGKKCVAVVFLDSGCRMII
jgi:hypothetical protein